MTCLHTHEIILFLIFISVTSHDPNRLIFSCRIEIRCKCSSLSRNVLKISCIYSTRQIVQDSVNFLQNIFSFTFNVLTLLANCFIILDLRDFYTCMYQNTQVSAICYKMLLCLYCYQLPRDNRFNFYHFSV